MPTASAVMGDIIIVISSMTTVDGTAALHINYPVKPIEEPRDRDISSASGCEQAGRSGEYRGSSRKQRCSIAQVVQKRARRSCGARCDHGFRAGEHFNDALMIVKGMSVLREVSGIIRVYGD